MGFYLMDAHLDLIVSKLALIIFTIFANEGKDFPYQPNPGTLYFVQHSK